MGLKVGGISYSTYKISAVVLEWGFRKFFMVFVLVFVTNVAIRLINIETDSSPKIHKNHNLKQKRWF